METEALERVLGQIHACCLRAATADAAALGRLEAQARALRADATPLVEAALAAGGAGGAAALRALVAADCALVLLMIRARAATVPPGAPVAAGRTAALLTVVATQLDAAATAAAERGDAAHTSRCVEAADEAGRQATALLFRADAEARRGA